MNLYATRVAIVSSLSPIGIARRAATFLFGAVPATMLLMLAFSLPGLRRADPVAFGLLIFAALGTLGLWRVTWQGQFSNRLNVGFLLFGLLAISPIVLYGLEEDPMWFVPRGFTKDSFEALLVLGPCVTAVAYLVAMGLRRFRIN